MIPFSYSKQHLYRLAVLLLTLLALGLRLWRLDSAPPGWRDDELINSLVISQKVLDGDLAVYYADASGHEAFYHALNAIPLALFGPSVLGIRLLSAILGTLAVPMTYLLGSRLFGRATGLIGSAALAVSFWSLMYSRIGLRHITMPLLVTLTFYFFWCGLTAADDPQGRRKSLLSFATAAVFMSLGFYTYFAGRGVPLILLAFAGYLWLFHRPLFRQHWRGMALMFLLAALLAVPLIAALGQQVESDARVAELAVPLVEARAGNFIPLWEYTRITLSMFHSDGDPEWLYNIPNRPVFGPAGALFFWVGVLLVLWGALKPLTRLLSQRTRGRTSEALPVQPTSLAAAFAMLWWLAGISPGFISVPPASLGHTIVAQPVTFLLMALPLGLLARNESIWPKRWRPRRNGLVAASAALLLAAFAWRESTAYFQEWPQRGMARFLYRADIKDVADYLSQHEDMNDFGIAGLLAGPWDRLALEVELGEARSAVARPRWYNPERAILLQPAVSFGDFPRVTQAYAALAEPIAGQEMIGGYRLKMAASALDESGQVCFENGLCWLTAHFDPAAGHLDLGWQIAGRLELPEIPLISNPPPPGVYAGPRLSVFAQVLDADGRMLVGDDGLWVDPLTLHDGDQFLQQHRLVLTSEARPAAVVFGLYDPKTGQRILTVDGRDHLRLEIEE